MGRRIDDKKEKEQISKRGLIKEKKVAKAHKCSTDDALVLLY